jgi:hypothetical protein
MKEIIEIRIINNILLIALIYYKGILNNYLNNFIYEIIEYVNLFN